MNVTVGGKEYPVSFTPADYVELGKGGWMGKLKSLPQLEGWDRAEALSHFISACIRRAGGTMTAGELLVAAKMTDFDGLYAAVPELLGMKVEGNSDPNAQGPMTTTT